MKRKKRKQRRLPPPINVGGSSPMGPTLGKPFRHRKPPPTELELNARKITELVGYIGATRRRIKMVEQDLSNERATLSNLMLEHQQATTKAAELSQIPQPVG